MQVGYRQSENFGTLSVVKVNPIRLNSVTL